jgi:PPOX class probable F420-dependent enzyme
MASMTPVQLDTFLRETRIAKLATLNSDGSPTIVPVWFEWDGATAAIFTEGKSPKVKRILADPRVALSVEEGVGVAEAWVTIEGLATIEREGGFALAQRLAPRYYTPERAGAALAEWGRVAEGWVVIRITPRRIRSSAPEG